MDHFEREAHLQWIIFGAPLVIGFLLTIVVLMCFAPTEAARADRCLDRGGSYDYEQSRCDFETRHLAP